MAEIPAKESLTIEFKSDRKTISDNVIVEEVVSLANTDGGSLYIGVEDDGEVTGAQPQHRNPVQIMALVANKTVPSVSTRVRIIDADLPVLCIEVPRSQSVTATASGKILRRRLKANGEPESIPMYPYEITTRLSDLGKLDFSAQPVPDSSKEDFSALELDRLRGIIESYAGGEKNLLELSDDELMKALRLTTSVGEDEVPTLTGILLIGKKESISQLVPTADAVFQVMQGTDVKVNTEYRAPLLATIEAINKAIEPWNPITEIALGLFNDPVPAFDRRAIREALVNAFGHRDYSVLGRVRVLIDDAGLTISNPGGFVEGISIENLLTADPHGRNPCLMDALKRVGLAERTGRGIDRIFEGSLRYGRPLPDYSDSTSGKVSLFIARGNPDVEFIEMITRESERTGSQLSLQSLLVLDALRRMRRAEYVTLKNALDIQSPRLRQVLENLIEFGLLEASGAGERRTYMLSSRVYKMTGKTKEYVRQTDIDKVRYPELIMKLAKQQGRITTSDVVDLLHLDKERAYYEIKKLIKEGKLKKAQDGPKAFYIPR